MRLAIREIHPASSKTTLNEEWFILENVGEKPFSTAGCSVLVGKGSAPRLRPLGPLDPGFTIAPQEKVRVITGNPGKKAHGKPPAEEGGIRNYHLFQVDPIVSGAGTTVGLALKQHEITRATFDPKAKNGVAEAKNP